MGLVSQGNRSHMYSLTQGYQTYMATAQLHSLGVKRHVNTESSL